MKTQAPPTCRKRRSRQRNRRGFALVFVLCLTGVSLLLVATTAQWAASECTLTARNNLYNDSVAAAESATENVLARVLRDFVYQSISSDLTAYRSLVPAQGGWPTQFEFSDGADQVNCTHVERLGPTAIADLYSEFTGLYGLITPYEVASRAKPVNTPYDLSATVHQDFQLACIPIFQFAIFYTLDLEINPGATMTVTGKVHGNADLYAAPPASLTFQDDVMAVGSIYNARHPNDPTGGSKTTPVYQKKKVAKVSSLSLPIGTNNSSQAVQQILDVPPWSEDPNSALGKQRFYNNADLIVSNSPAGRLTVRSGAWNGFAPIPPDGVSGTNTYYTFVTNAQCFDQREQKTVTATEIDVGKLKTWMLNATTNGGAALNNLAKYYKNHELNSIYALDTRPNNSTHLPAVRVTNGALLPNDGLTVVTPLPLYVKGHFNLNNGSTTVGNTDTSQTKPAALIGDALTILSASWLDSRGGSALSTRQAANTTVNAAFLGGIVPSSQVGGTKRYSGGVENFPRFLEDWSGYSLTYNGSMVVMFPSRYATGFWLYGDPVYTAPSRHWAFDLNFLNPNRLPPLTPQVRKLVRGQWRVVASN